MARTMNISLPDELREFVEQQVRDRAFGSTSEYVRELIRKQRDVEKLRGLLLQGRDSGPPELVDDGWFNELRARVKSKSSA